MERFIKPTDKQLVDFAIMFCESNGRINWDDVRNTTAALMLVVDRLYENGDITIRTTKEKKDEAN